MTDSSDPNFRVDTEALDRATARLQEIADRMDSLGRDTQYRLAELGAPWGDDETGNKFYEQYKDPASKVIDAALQSGSVLRDTTQQLSDMVKVYVATEAQAAAQAAAQGQSIGGDSGSGSSGP